MILFVGWLGALVVLVTAPLVAAFYWMNAKSIDTNDDGDEDDGDEDDGDGDDDNNDRTTKRRRSQRRNKTRLVAWS